MEGVELELALLNGKAFFEGRLQEKNIGIEDGKIKEIKNEKIDAEKIIDCNGLIVLPGVIDPHVHFREPGMVWKEDFKTGSMAAAAGGITTVIDMPNTKPPTTTVKALEEKRKLAKKSLINYGFHFGSDVDNLEEIKKAWEMNIASVKVFMDISTGKMLIRDEEKLGEIFCNSKIVSVHAEGENVKKAVEIAKKCNNKLYVCHVSSRQELDYAKEGGMLIEVTPHHLFLNEGDIKDNFLKVAPKLKSRADQQALWNGINKGIVSTIGSDHAPHTVAEKMFVDAPNGVPGEETMLPLLLNAVNEGKLKIETVVRLCCENPAEIFGIKNKGKIALGYDADITVVDLGKEEEVMNGQLFTKCKWSPFNGLKLKGVVEKTIVNGNVVFDNRTINEEVKGKEVVFE